MAQNQNSISIKLFEIKDDKYSRNLNSLHFRFENWLDNRTEYKNSSLSSLLLSV